MVLKKIIRVSLSCGFVSQIDWSGSSGVNLSVMNLLNFRKAHEIGKRVHLKHHSAPLDSKRLNIRCQ